MIERALGFGPHKSLVGIWTAPTAAAEETAGRPVTLFLNSGLLHRVGPSRLYVQLARRLAAMGYPSFRFDFSGIGESDGAGDGLSHEARMVREAQTAMDFLGERVGAQRFVTLGICSGADVAHRIAVADARVTGAVFLDGYYYPTVGYYWRHYRKRLTDPRRWLGFLPRVWRALRSPRSEDAEYMLDLGTLPPRGVVQRDLEKLIARKIRMLHVYTGGVGEHYNYRDQFFDIFRSVRPEDGLRVDYLPDVDHTFILESDRRRLIALITDWMQQQEIAGTPGSANRAGAKEYR